MFFTLPTRLVSRSQSRAGVARIKSNKSHRQIGFTSLSNTSASEAQNTRGLRPFVGVLPSGSKPRSASFCHRSGFFQFASLVLRRGWPAPHTTPSERAGVLTDA